jgi:hypothetical protein
MATYTFKKVSGGVKFDKAGASDLLGICAFDIVQVDLNDQGGLTLRLRGQRHVIHVATDTVTVDYSSIGGGSTTYGPGTIAASVLQDKLMDIFNPFSNIMMA